MLDLHAGGESESESELQMQRKGTLIPLRNPDHVTSINIPFCLLLFLSLSPPSEILSMIIQTRAPKTNIWMKKEVSPRLDGTLILVAQLYHYVYEKYSQICH